MLSDALSEMTGMSYHDNGTVTSCISECPQMIMKIQEMLTFRGIYMSDLLRGGSRSGNLMMPGLCGGFVELALTPSWMVYLAYF